MEVLVVLLGLSLIANIILWRANVRADYQLLMIAEKERAFNEGTIPFGWKPRLLDSGKVENAWKCPKCTKCFAYKKFEICGCELHHNDHYHFKCDDCSFSSIMRTADDSEDYNRDEEMELPPKKKPGKENTVPWLFNMVKLEGSTTKEWAYCCPKCEKWTRDPHIELKICDCGAYEKDHFHYDCKFCKAKLVMRTKDDY
jgi:hypothetical protein